MKLDYEKLGLKSGIEIHQQMDTARKLFWVARRESSDCRRSLAAVGPNWAGR